MIKPMIKGGSQYRLKGRSHYERNKDSYLEKNKEIRERNRAYVRSIKESGACSDCGISDFRVLDFDHLPGQEKRAEVSRMVAYGFSIESIKKEIAKCDLVCANCHRIRTHERNAVLV